MKKVLLACPTSKAKNYCYEQWIDSVMQIKYPNLVIRMFDNTDDSGKNAKLLNEIFEKKYGETEKFKVIHSKVFKEKSLLKRMTISSNEMRDYAIKNEFDALFSLESDVFCPPTTVEDLLAHRLKVVGALYYRDSGKYRKPTLQYHVFTSTRNLISKNFTHEEDFVFVDGDLKKVSAVGLGAVMIDINVLKKIPFRTEKGNPNHPDTHFSEDCFRNGIPIYCDTSIICRHLNVEWADYGTKGYN